MIEAPDGSTATYDAARTRQAYANPAIGANCDCAGCRNYRAAWSPEFFQPDLLATCIEIGIEPAKAFETTAVAFDRGLVLYTGEFPFYGDVSNQPLVSESPWSFSSHPFGSAKFSEGLVTIGFFVGLPWVLSEPNPYA